MEFRFNTKELKAVVKRVRPFAQESFIVKFTDAKAPDDATKCLASVTVSNGTAQVIAALRYSTENFPKEMTINFGKTFGDAADMLCEFGEVLSVCLAEKSAKLTCGTAVMPVDVLDSAISFPIEMEKESIRISMDRKAFNSLVNEGCAETSPNTTTPMLDSTCSIHPMVTASGEPMLRIYSCDGYGVARAEVACDVQDMEGFTKWAEDGCSLLLRSTNLLGLARKDDPGVIQLVMNKSQVIIIDGNDIVAFMVMNAVYPASIITLLEKNYTPAFSMEFNKNELKKASQVVLFNEDKQNMELTITGTEIILTSESGAKTAKIKGTGTDKFSVYLNGKLLTRLLDKFTDDSVRIEREGDDQKLCLYIFCGNKSVRTLLMPVNR